MERSDPRYQAYVEILKEELIPAMGCTEPIALAYAAAKAREVLGMLPESVQLQVSGSIMKEKYRIQGENLSRVSRCRIEGRVLSVARCRQYKEDL